MNFNKAVPRAKLALKLILNYKIPGKHSKIRQDDTFLVSYPKSGNTWMRFILANLISQQKIDFVNFNSIVPDIITTYKKELDRLHSPRIIKSHEPYVSKYPKVIYIYRDPRDVVISYYYWNVKYKRNFVPISEYIEQFIIGDNSPYGPWDTHLKTWMSLTNTNEILVLKYEDLKINSFKTVKNVTEFLKLTVSDDDIIKAIENSSFENMKKLENDQHNSSSYLKNSRKDIGFVRSGKSEWKSYFSDDLKEKFKIKYGQFLIELGYEKDFNW